MPSLLVFDSIRPGRSSGDAKVNDLKVIQYNKGELKVKIDFDGVFSELPCRMRRGICDMDSFPTLRKTPIKITNRKWMHLQELKAVIPQDCHAFYDNLPHE